MWQSHFVAMASENALIAEARKVAEKRGIPLGLDVWSFNQQALNFFDQQGFKTIREILFA